MNWRHNRASQQGLYFGNIGRCLGTRAESENPYFHDSNRTGVVIHPAFHESTLRFIQSVVYRRCTPRAPIGAYPLCADRTGARATGPECSGAYGPTTAGLNKSLNTIEPAAQLVDRAASFLPLLMLDINAGGAGITWGQGC